MLQRKENPVGIHLSDEEDQAATQRQQEKRQHQYMFLYVLPIMVGSHHQNDKVSFIVRIIKSRAP